MKKLLTLLLFLFLCLLTACSRQASQMPSQEIQSNVTLSVVTSYGGDDGSRGKFEAAVKAYESASGNRVLDNSALSNEEWKTEVLTDFMTGSEPDVLFYFTNADADPFINAGKVVSIEEIRRAYPDYATNMKESMMAVAADGQHYAVPSYGYWENLFVNKAILAECGISIPGPDYTWEQFLADCAVIKDRGYTPIACSLYEIPHYWFEFTVMNNGSKDDHLQIPSLDEQGELILDETAKKWIAALEDIRFLYNAGYFPVNTLTATDAQTADQFGRGEAAFLIDGSWKVGYFSNNYPENAEDFMIAYVPGKGDRPASDAIGGISMGYFITRKAWDDPLKRQAAVEFVFHMTSEEVLSTFVTTEVTALVSGAAPSGLTPLQQSAADANTQLTGVVEAVQDSISGDAKRVLFDNIQKIVTGQMTPEAVITAAIRMNET